MIWAGKQTCKPCDSSSSDLAKSSRSKPRTLPTQHPDAAVRTDRTLHSTICQCQSQVQPTTAGTSFPACFHAFCGGTVASTPSRTVR